MLDFVIENLGKIIRKNIEYAWFIYIGVFVTIIFLESLIKSLLNFSFIGLNIFFIIPFGVLVITFAVLYPFFLVKYEKGLELKKVDYVLSFLLALLAVCIVHFTTYTMTYVAPDSSTKYAYSRSLIKNDLYSADQYVHVSEVLAFSDYLNFLRGADLDFSRKGRPIGSVENQYIKDILILLQFAFVGILIWLLNLAFFLNRKRCENCKIYYKNVFLVNVAKDNFEGFIQNFKKNELGESFQAIVNRSRDLVLDSKDLKEVNLFYCEKCLDFYFEVSELIINDKGQLVRDKAEVIEIDNRTKLKSEDLKLLKL